MGRQFQQTYGPWALVAGASKGVGAAFARTLAEMGFHLVLLARGEEGLRKLASELENRYSVKTVALTCDLSRDDLIDVIDSETAAYEIGLFIYNAVYSQPGPYLSLHRENHRKIIETNCRGPALLSHYFADRMAGRMTGSMTGNMVSGEAGRSKEHRSGGIILMASLSGFQGTPYVTHYSASKAYLIALAEGLRYELQPHGVDVLASCPGPINTQAFVDSLRGRKAPAFPPIIEPDQVAKESLQALGKRTIVVPGRSAGIASILLRRLLPRQTAVNLMGRATEKLYKA